MENREGSLDTSEMISNVSIQLLNESMSNDRELSDGTFKGFSEEDYQMLEKNIVAYKSGDVQYAFDIIRSFHYFLMKYCKFVRYGSIPRVKSGTKRKFDPSLTKFIALYISKNDRESGEDRKKVFADTCERIHSMFSKYTLMDLYDELVLALLNMVCKYEIRKEGDPYYHKNGSFHMYVQRCFHWEAYRALNKLVKDPLAWDRNMALYEFDEKEAALTNDASGCHLSVFLEDHEARIAMERALEESNRYLQLHNTTALKMYEENVSCYDTNSLNFNWQNGISCSELFLTLTNYERELLVLSYMLNKTDVQIAKLYGCNRSTINEHKKRAIEKLRKGLKEERKQ